MPDDPRRRSVKIAPGPPPHAAMISNLSNPAYKKLGGLEKEDMIIVVLSAVLVIATIWLATQVL